MTENTGTTPTPAPPPTYPPAARPPLRRSQQDRVIAGVAGGFGRWLGIDPVIVRVVLVVLAVFGGSGLLLYAIGWLFIPEEGEPSSQAERLLDSTRQPHSTGRTVLLVIGVVVAVLLLGGIASAGVWGGAWGGGWLLLLAAGALVVWLVNRPPSGMTAPSAVPVDSTSGQSSTSVPDPGSHAPAVQAPPTAETTAATTGYAYGGYGGYPGYQAPAPSPRPAPAPTPRSYLGLATVSLAVLTMGILGSLAISDAVSIPAVVVLSAGLGVLGVGLLVGTAIGRARWLIALALPLLLVTAVVALVPADLRISGGIGEATWTPMTAADVSEDFRLGIGSAALDLTELQLADGTTVPIDASVGVGELLVTVPQGVNVVVAASTDVGRIAIGGLPELSGQDQSITTDLPGFVPDTAPTIELTIDVNLGNLEVSRA